MASPNFHSFGREIKIAYDVPTQGTRRWKNKGRKIKTFTNAYAARAFWIKKDQQGMNPKVINPDKESKDENISSGMGGDQGQQARRRFKRDKERRISRRGLRKSHDDDEV